MIILGIETSCDETAAAIVKSGKTVMSNTLMTSVNLHEKHGGIIPEIASRRQLEYITDVVDTAIKKANLTVKQLDAIAVTTSPGLIGSLLVGTSFAKSMAAVLKKPLINVNHIKAHLYASFLQTPTDSNKEAPTLPAIGLVASGGHTALYNITDFSSIKLIGQTKDDAIGETFDKVAKILNLGYPGGPVIDRLAKKEQAGKQRIKQNIHFKCAPMVNTFDFSFSGIKTAVLYYYRDHAKDEDFSVQKVARAFQNSVVDIIVKKCMSACKKYNRQTLLLGGGVACNSWLRRQLLHAATQENIKVFFPEPALCTDNAAMIAGWGYHLRN